MLDSYDIHKAAAIIIKDRQLLVERSRGKEVFVPPGGKLEPGETAKEALVRELKEELGLDISKEDLKFFGTFYAQAAGNETKKLRMDVFILTQWSGALEPDNEIDEIRWIDSKIVPNIKSGSILEHNVLPRLTKMGLVG